MTELPFAASLRPELAELRAYVPLQGEYAVRLDANEAPPLLSETGRARLAEVARATPWERYPDATHRRLREAVADYSAVGPDEVLVGVGSDEIISVLLTALAVPRPRAQVASVMTTTPSFVMYRLSARVRGMVVIEVPLDDDWDLVTSSFRQAIAMGRPNLVFIASPNNPTGNLVDRARLEQIVHTASDALVVIDEAYVDYAGRQQLDLFRDYENVAVLRTLSKVGFASLRLGWMIARPELISELNKARLPYNANALSQRLGVVVLNELRSEIEHTRRYVVAERRRVGDELGRIEGVTVSPSEANFLWLRTERPAGEVFAGLCERGVLVRSFHESGGRLANRLRVTIGSRAENDRFLEALHEVV